MKRFRRYSTNASGSTTGPEVERWIHEAFRTESMGMIPISDHWSTGEHNLAVLSHKEVAKRIGMTTEGVKNVERRALRKLRKAFRNEIEERGNEIYRKLVPPPPMPPPPPVYEPEPSDWDIAWERFCKFDDEQKRLGNQLVVDSGVPSQ